MQKSVVSPTAADVRKFYQSNEKRFSRLPESAQKTVAPGARGRLAPQVIADYNRGRKTERQYVLGVSVRTAQARAEQRAALREKGLAGARGPLSKAALASVEKV